MRIAHIHWSLGTGGIETMLPDIVNEQAKTNDVALVIERVSFGINTRKANNDENSTHIMVDGHGRHGKHGSGHSQCSGGEQ